MHRLLALPNHRITCLPAGRGFEILKSYPQLRSLTIRVDKLKLYIYDKVFLRQAAIESMCSREQINETTLFFGHLFVQGGVYKTNLFHYLTLAPLFAA